MAMRVEHIADVSLSHFFGGGDEPRTDDITVNHNTFTVSFVNGKVHAQFVSGNAFTNFFRSSTLERLKRTLQDQYDSWIAGQKPGAANEAHGASSSAAPKGISNVAKATKAVETCRGILEKTNPPGAEKLLARLEDINTLANLRNTVAGLPTGSECDQFVRDAGFLTHTRDNCDGQGEAEIKRYVLNMLDTVVDGFVQAFEQMTDRNAQLPDFLRMFDGACVEAKGDNIQEWLSRSAGVVKAARSDSSNNLADSVTFEFNAIADEVRKPFADAARAACEAGIRAKCVQDGVVDEDEIASRIESKVQVTLLEKESEIAPLIRKKLKGDGRFAVYEALAGAKRPMTEIAKDKETGRWTVTTLTDKSGKPILKSVSGLDIDRNYDLLVDMYMEDAVLMGTVEYKTRVEANVSFATREDLRAKGVLETAKNFSTGKLDGRMLRSLVMKEVDRDTDTFPGQLIGLYEDVLDEIVRIDRYADDEKEEFFRRFLDNYATAAYLDKTSDVERLAHLIARRVEVKERLVRSALLKDVDIKAARCAQMLKMSNPDYKVNTALARDCIARVIKRLVADAYSTDRSTPTCLRKAERARQYLNAIQYNGTFFFDRFEYDLGHRAAGRDEINLHKAMGLLMHAIMKYEEVSPESIMVPSKA